MHVSSDKHTHTHTPSHASDTIYLYGENDDGADDVMIFMKYGGWLTKNKLAIHFHFHADFPLITHTICEHHTEMRAYNCFPNQQMLSFVPQNKFAPLLCLSSLI